jgi:hypothetical protein
VFSVNGIVHACRLPLYAYVGRCTRLPYYISEPLLYITFFSSYGLRYGNKDGSEGKDTDLRGKYTDILNMDFYRERLDSKDGMGLDE